MMAYQLEFTHLVNYDAGEPGITVPVILHSGSTVIPVDAKLDCGSSYCIFQRVLGEMLGFDIERGYPQKIGTAMGAFLTYGHEATLSVQGVKFDIVAYFAANYEFTRNVVGRHGFLNRMVTGLNDSQGLFYWRSLDEYGA